MSMSKRCFAFDWGGSLENNESLRQIARDLYKADYGVYVVPAAGLFPTDETYASWLMLLGVPYTGFRRVLDVGLGSQHIADGKVTAMRELGCQILYDDNFCNVDTVRAAGLEAVLVIKDGVVERPPELSSTI